MRHTGFLELQDLARNEITRMVEGRAELGHTELYIDNKRVLAQESMRTFVHSVTPLNYSITEWSIAEYLMLNGPAFKKPLLKTKGIVRDAQSLLDRMGFAIDARSKMGRTSEYTKRLVDLAKGRTLRM